MAKKKIARTAVKIALELADIRGQKDNLMLVDKALTSELKDALHAEQIDRAGNYKISKVISLKVIELETALQWAATTNCLKVDTAKAKEILRHTFDDPEKFGFGKVETESIRPIKSSSDEDE